jgi:outer membrane protein OmpU
MKKILLSTAALAGLAIVAASPVRAEEPALQLGLGGYISAYGVYTSQDEAVGTDFRSFDVRKDTEIHLNGEVALDNGITAGAHLELLGDRQDATTVEESYLYLSSAFGRVNLGEEDGVAYLLQVAAPSADEVIDGIRPDVGTFQNSGTSNLGGTLDYAHDDFGYANKITYITPVFSGFQAGVSFTPSATAADQAGSNPSLVSNTVGADLENALEFAGRYEGSFDALDIALGAGYSTAEQEVEAAAEDDLQTWNVGANIGYGAFGLGAAYLSTNNAVGGTAADDDTDTYVVGADYTIGAYKLGVSYLNQQNENATNDQEIDRWTAGTVYEWGPGMTFRGSVQYQDAENVGGTATADRDGTQFALGTQLTF